MVHNLLCTIDKHLACPVSTLLRESVLTSISGITGVAMSFTRVMSTVQSTTMFHLMSLHYTVCVCVRTCVSLVGHHWPYPHSNLAIVNCCSKPHENIHSEREREREKVKTMTDVTSILSLSPSLWIHLPTVWLCVHKCLVFTRTNGNRFMYFRLSHSPLYYVLSLLSVLSLHV